MTRTRRTPQSPGARAGELAWALTGFCVLSTLVLQWAFFGPLVQFVVWRLVFAWAVKGAQDPSVAAGPIHAGSLPLVGLLWLACLGAWWWALRTFREQNAAGKSLEELRALSPAAFEEWVAARFRDLGHATELTGTQGDHGIDLVATKDGGRAVIQCKRYAGVVGEPVLRDLLGSMHAQHADRAYLVTTGALTRQAADWVKGKPIEVWDGAYLGRLSGQLARQKGDTHGQAPNGAVSVFRRGAPEQTETGAEGAPCPTCAAPLLVRRNRATGERFLGCSSYPRCRYTRQLSTSA